MVHQAEKLPPHPVWNAYQEKEQKSLETVPEVPVDKIPRDSKIITNHVLYKVKQNEG